MAPEECQELPALDVEIQVLDDQRPAVERLLDAHEPHERFLGIENRPGRRDHDAPSSLGPLSPDSTPAIYGVARPPETSTMAPVT
jgi:hypothetical protein